MGFFARLFGLEPSKAELEAQAKKEQEAKEAQLRKEEEAKKAEERRLAKLAAQPPQSVCVAL